jgi:hypothetical protein
MNCARCGRKVLNPVRVGDNDYGSKCAVAVGGAQPKRRKAAAQAAREVDKRQRDFFAEDLSYARRVDSLLGSISLEMPRG